METKILPTVIGLLPAKETANFFRLIPLIPDYSTGAVPAPTKLKIVYFYVH
jgi:hypothetical protein